MSSRQWTDAARTALRATLGLYVVLFPGFAVAYALATGAPIFARPPQVIAAVVALVGSYPFVTGAWSERRLLRFALGVWVASGAVGMLGLVLVANLDASLPSSVVARGVVLAVAYPAGVAVAFRDRLGTGAQERPPAP